MRRCLPQYGFRFSGLSLYQESTSLPALSGLPEQPGYSTLAARASQEQLINEMPAPYIIHWRKRHYMVVYKAVASGVYVADPAAELEFYDTASFLKGGLAPAHPGRGIVPGLEKK